MAKALKPKQRVTSKAVSKSTRTVITPNARKKTLAQRGEELFVTWGHGESALPVASLQEATNLMALQRALGRSHVRLVRGVITSYDAFIKGKVN